MRRALYIPIEKFFPCLVNIKNFTTYFNTQSTSFHNVYTLQNGTGSGCTAYAYLCFHSTNHKRSFPRQFYFLFWFYSTCPISQIRVVIVQNKRQSNMQTYVTYCDYFSKITDTYIVLPLSLSLIYLLYQPTQKTRMDGKKKQFLRIANVEIEDILRNVYAIGTCQLYRRKI